MSFSNKITLCKQYLLTYVHLCQLQSIQLFMGTPVNPSALDYHIHAVQHITKAGIRYPALQNEIYCLILQQMFGQDNIGLRASQGLCHTCFSSFTHAFSFLFILKLFANARTLNVCSVYYGNLI